MIIKQNLLKVKINTIQVPLEIYEFLFEIFIECKKNQNYFKIVLFKKNNIKYLNR